MSGARDSARHIHIRIPPSPGCNLPSRVVAVSEGSAACARRTLHSAFAVMRASAPKGRARSAFIVALHASLRPMSGLSVARIVTGRSSSDQRSCLGGTTLPLRGERSRSRRRSSAVPPWASEIRRATLAAVAGDDWMTSATWAGVASSNSAAASHSAAASLVACSAVPVVTVKSVRQTRQRHAFSFRPGRRRSLTQ